MGDSRTSLEVGARLLSDEDGYLVVVELGRHAVTVENSTGVRREIPYGEVTGCRIVDGRVEAALEALEPWWWGLPEGVRQIALFRLEVVLEVLTGYRWGHPRLAQPGEPYLPFGDTETSIFQRCERMARQLAYEQQRDRVMIRRIQDGELTSDGVSVSTVRGWVRAWQKHGLRGLVDKRSTRGSQGFDALDERVRRIADDLFARFNGDESKVNLETIKAEILLRMKEDGIADVQVPERLFQEYLSERHRALGGTTRAHRSRHLRRAASAHTSFAAMYPGHLAVDVTRADVRVWDEIHECPRNVEIITVISVATRVIVALRVVPQSANGLEAGLVLYDAMRPMSMLVDGTTVEDWRWCGVPELLDLTGVTIHRSPKRMIPPGQSLQSIQGVHHKPGVNPISLRADNGSVFVSEPLRALLRDLGVDLMLSRGSKPTDNPHIERVHETFQRAYQALPGFKGRNVSERGRRVDEPGEALLTAAELERHLRRFVALDYHRSWHQGLVLPGAEKVRLSPLEMWDAMMQATGRIDVPQHPDLIYQFLPKAWLAIGHAGVEYKNLSYDGEILEEFRDLRRGAFKAGSRQVPFHYDPRDMTRIWLRHPDSDRIHEIGLKAAHLRDLPLSDFMVDRAIVNVRARGGNRALKADSARRQIIDELGRLTTAKETAELRAQSYAARVRREQAQRDHAEAAEAAALLDGSDGVVTPIRRREQPANDSPLYDVDEVWPDYDELDGG